MALYGYYNRFNKSKKYTKLLFLAGKGLQSAELNELQSYSEDAFKRFGDALFHDGDIISGCSCVVDSATGAVTAESGQIYLNGLIRDVSGAYFMIPTDCEVRIGIYFKENTITSLEDPELRDPAVGTRGYQEIGAARSQYQLTWGFQVVGGASQTEENGRFFSIQNVENGVIPQRPTVEVEQETIDAATARYDNDSNGSYAVRGFKATCVEANDLTQTYTISEGKAHVYGYEVELNHSTRKVFDNNIDFGEVYSDPYVFEPNAQGEMTIHLNYTPLAEIRSVDITAERTVTLTHGSYNGCLDPIPSQSVLQIISVRQNTTVFQQQSDFRLTQGQVDWTPNGNEPAPGSTYEVKYQYRTQITPTEVTDDGFKISGAVSNSMVLVSYTWKMPRYDVLTLDSHGNIRRIKGLAHPWSPVVPTIPSNQLSLAQIYQTWRSGEMPVVKNNAIQAILMSDIESMRNMISDLYYLVAQEQLKNDANASDPSAKKGVFVDPFFDDDMRDQGVSQTGAIVNKQLLLPIEFDPVDMGRDESVYLLPYELEPVVSQEHRTGWMKVNPYQAFDPIPATVTLNLRYDYWTEYRTVWTSPVYRQYASSWSGRTESTELVGTRTVTAQYMRRRTQNFSVTGFRAGERVSSIVFAGVDIVPQEA